MLSEVAFPCATVWHGTEAATQPLRPPFQAVPRCESPPPTSLDVAPALLREDPRELASWVNQIDGYRAHFLLFQDPRELASWVNQIES